jgi:hypothetical protein
MFVGRREGCSELMDALTWRCRIPSIGHHFGYRAFALTAMPGVIEFSKQVLQWVSFLRPFGGRWRTLHTYFYLRSRRPALER